MSDVAAPLIINCTVDNPTLTVGDVRVLTCDLKGAPVTPQSKFEFSSQGDLQAVAATKTQYQIQFLGAPKVQGVILSQDVTSYKVGTPALNQIKLKIDNQEYPVAPLSLNIKSVIQQTTNSNPTPFPIVGPEGVAIPLWWWGTVGFFLAIIISIVAWQVFEWRKRKRVAQAVANAPKISPQERFQAKIRKLESKGFHNRGEYKQFALELTNIIKKTIGEELHFPAEDLTSEELLSTLERRHRSYSNTAGMTLSYFLADLDQIKFAKIETDAQKCSELLNRGAQIGNALFGRIG